MLRNNRTVLIVLSLGFFAFSFGNNTAISRSQVILVEINSQFHDQKFLQRFSQPSMVAVMKAYDAKPVTTIQWTHYIFTLLVIMGLWAPCINQRVSQKNDIKKNNTNT